MTENKYVFILYFVLLHSVNKVCDIAINGFFLSVLFYDYVEIELLPKV